MSLLARYQAILARIDAACLAAGRDREEVRLIAVSKTFPIEPIAELFEAGQLDFGESYAQELRDKAPQLPGAHWHFIGRLQTNKAKYIAPHAYRVHAVGDERHVDALVAKADHPLDVLISVNLGEEAQKTGVGAESAMTLARNLADRDDVRLRGLMCIPPWDEPAEPYFAQLAELAARGRAEGLPLDELSMGMSADFETAIAHGATWIRVGSAIFGARD
ncbi:MAG: YggS family pyridoxal phosphate-dependent enzyme [Deltaproteobacteria bacterium]|nr:MAG: YggS family pyridoxal phosphate-dependent enzyme [Deltaproteobacteria bacterium]